MKSHYCNLAHCVYATQRFGAVLARLFTLMEGAHVICKTIFSEFLTHI